MKFVVDQQLPPDLARWIVEKGHEAVHVQECGLGDADDGEIWAFALSEAATIVSKDTDFAHRRIASAAGPSVVWLRLGNTTNPVLLALMENAWPAISSALLADEPIIEVW